MRWITPALIMSCAFLVSGAVTPADAGPRTACADFLSDLEGGEDGSAALPVIYDLESLLGISSADELTAAYDALQALNSGCSPGKIESAEPEEIMSPWRAPAYVDVAAGIHGATRWIQFVYPSIGDFGPGLVSSVVFYDGAGDPKASHRVSEYHSWENTSVLRSVVVEGEIVSCRQHIEYFFYDQNGDVAGELGSPKRSACEITSISYPHR